MDRSLLQKTTKTLHEIERKLKTPHLHDSFTKHELERDMSKLEECMDIYEKEIEACEGCSHRDERRMEIIEQHLKSIDRSQNAALIKLHRLKKQAQTMEQQMGEVDKEAREFKEAWEAMKEKLRYNDGCEELMRELHRKAEYLWYWVDQKLAPFEDYALDE